LSAGGSITPTLKVGTILIEERPRITKFLELDSESCSGKWSVVRGLDGFALDRKIHAAGWNFFFMAEEVKAIGHIGLVTVLVGDDPASEVYIRLKHKAVFPLPIISPPLASSIQ